MDSQNNIVYTYQISKIKQLKRLYMPKHTKQGKKIDISKEKDILPPSSSNTPSSTLYGEYYNKNILYIYKDNSTTRVTYDNKSNEYIERKYT